MSEHHLSQYLPCSEQDLLWGTAITGAGHQEMAPYQHYPPSHPSLYSFTWERGRVLDELQLVYIVKGRGRYSSSKDKIHDVKAGTIMVIRPNQWHRYQPLLSLGWKEYWLGMKGPHVSHLLSAQCIPKELTFLSVGIREDLVQWYMQIERLLVERPFMVQQMSASLAHVILTKAISIHRSKQNSMGDDHMNEAILRLLECAESDCDLKRLALDLGMSYDQFRHQFKSFTGLSPRQYHLQIKLQRACELLNQTDDSVKSISERLSFESPFYFSRIFKSKQGCSPLQWRKRALS
jgi:AraC-like DNA-binding protein